MYKIHVFFLIIYSFSLPAQSWETKDVALVSPVVFMVLYSKGTVSRGLRYPNTFKQQFSTKNLKF